MERLILSSFINPISRAGEHMLFNSKSMWLVMLTGLLAQAAHAGPPVQPQVDECEKATKGSSDIYTLERNSPLGKDSKIKIYVANERVDNLNQSNLLQTAKNFVILLTTLPTDPYQRKVSVVCRDGTKDVEASKEGTMIFDADINVEVQMTFRLLADGGKTSWPSDANEAIYLTEFPPKENPPEPCPKDWLGCRDVKDVQRNSQGDITFNMCKNNDRERWYNYRIRLIRDDNHKISKVDPLIIHQPH